MTSTESREELYRWDDRPKASYWWILPLLLSRLDAYWCCLPWQNMLLREQSRRVSDDPCVPSVLISISYAWSLVHAPYQGWEIKVPNLKFNNCYYKSVYSMNFVQENPMVLFISLYMWFRIAQDWVWTLNVIWVAFYNKLRHEDKLYNIIFGRPNRDHKKLS